MLGAINRLGGGEAGTTIGEGFYAVAQEPMIRRARHFAAEH